MLKLLLIYFKDKAIIASLKIHHKCTNNSCFAFNYFSDATICIATESKTCLFTQRLRRLFIKTESASPVEKDKGGRRAGGKYNNSLLCV
jgi:hypothetical protein